VSLFCFLKFSNDENELGKRAARIPMMHIAQNARPTVKCRNAKLSSSLGGYTTKKSDRNRPNIDTDIKKSIVRV
jgi:hypothetical protein